LINIWSKKKEITYLNVDHTIKNPELIWKEIPLKKPGKDVFLNNTHIKGKDLNE
jgi:hypothetical protein